MNKNTKMLMMTILFIALLQMPHLAITPGIDLIAEKIFPEQPFETIQTVMSLPSILSVAGGVLAALMVRYGLARKKTLVVAGMLIVSATGVTAFFLHTQFWQLCLLNVLIGVGMGIFIPTTQSIAYDSFDEKTLNLISGMQFSFINGGGIIMSVLGGMLTRLVWYGGHLVTLAAIPVAIVAIIVIPKDKKQSGKDVVRTKLPRDVYYYTALILVYMIVNNVAAMNLSTHIANGGIGDSGTAGVATAAMMAGGVVGGLLFSKLSLRLRDNLFPLSFLLLAIGYSILNLFPASLALTIVAMFICGTTVSLFVPRTILRVSSLTNASNSATATMLIASVGPGVGAFLSPIIITNITHAIAGNSTRFRYQFAAAICVLLAGLMHVINVRRDKRPALAANAR